jgi:hypothetical protein
MLYYQWTNSQTILCMSTDIMRRAHNVDGGTVSIYIVTWWLCVMRVTIGDIAIAKLIIFLVESRCCTT